MTAAHAHPIPAKQDHIRLCPLLQQAAPSLGFDPHAQPVVLDLAALAIARLAWRDSPVEDWHAAPDSRITDADLMRATVNVTRRVRELLDAGTTPHPARTRVTETSPAGEACTRLHARQSDDPTAVFEVIQVMLTAPDRRLPDGRQMQELAPTPEELATYGDHIHALHRRWMRIADHEGASAVLLLLASYAAVSCRRWWLGLDWPYLVTEFLARLKNPARWGNPALIAHARGLVPPAQAIDPDDLRAALLAGPDHLDADTARYCLRAGIGNLLPRDYHRPPRPRHVLPAAVLALIEPAPPAYREPLP